MVKGMIKKILFYPPLAQLLLDLILKINSKTYFWASTFAISLSKTKEHPKHGILKYKEWFLDRCQPDDVVLDVGCNTGSMLELMGKKVRYGYGIDIVKSHIDQAKKNNSTNNIEFIHGDATTFDYSNLQPITLITLSNVLEHIDKRVDFLTQIIKKVNWKNGYAPKILIRVPTIERDWISVFKKERGLDYRLDQTHYIEYTERELINDLNKSGIEVNSICQRFGEIYVVGSVILGE